MSLFSRLFGKGDEAGEAEAEGTAKKTKQCPKCRTELSEDAMFCGECGSSLSVAPPAPAAKPAQTPAKRAPASGAEAPRKGTATAAPKQGAPRASHPSSPDRRPGADRRSVPEPPAPSHRPAVSEAALGDLFAPSDAPAPIAARAAGPAGPARGAVVTNGSPSPEPEVLTLVEPLSDRPPPPPPARAPQAAAALDARPAPRPPAPSAPMIDTTLDEVDSGFDSLVAEEGAASSEPKLDTTQDMVAARQLFEQLAAHYVRPLRDFIIELSWNDPPREWLDISLAPATALLGSARKMEMAALCEALERFIAALRAAGESARDARIQSPVKEAIRAAYAGLVEVMPEGFAPDGERNRREPIIVRSLLAQVPDVHPLVLDRIHAAGLSTLAAFFVARSEDVAQTTGMPIDLAEAILDHFQRYRRESEALVPANGRAAERQMIAELVDELRRRHAEFERASSAWTEEATDEKKRLRRERENTVSRLSIVLARLGEVELVDRIEKLPFQRKIRELEGYLDESKGKSTALA